MSLQKTRKALGALYPAIALPPLRVVTQEVCNLAKRKPGGWGK